MGSGRFVSIQEQTIYCSACGHEIRRHDDRIAIDSDSGEYHLHLGCLPEPFRVWMGTWTAINLDDYY